MSLDQAWVVQTALNIGSTGVHLASELPQSRWVPFATEGDRHLIQAPSERILSHALEVSRLAVALTGIVNGMGAQDLTGLHTALRRLNDTFTTDTNRLYLKHDLAKKLFDLQRDLTQGPRPLSFPRLHLTQKPQGTHIDITANPLALGAIHIHGQETHTHLYYEGTPSLRVFIPRHKFSLTLISATPENQDRFIDYFIFDPFIKILLGALESFQALGCKHRYAEKIEDFVATHHRILGDFEPAPAISLTQPGAWEENPDFEINFDDSSNTPFSITPTSNRGGSVEFSLRREHYTGPQTERHAHFSIHPVNSGLSLVHLGPPSEDTFAPLARYLETFAVKF